MPRFVLIASAGDRREALFQAALARCGLPAADVITYPDVFGDADALAARLHGADVVRVDSPGKDAHALAALTGRPPDDAAPRGELFDSARWYAGFSAAMGRIEAALPANVRLMAHPAEAALMFDKTASGAVMSAAGVPMPRYLGAPRSHAEVLDLMRARGVWRVFLKLRHGSSASGAVAYRTNGRAHHAITTVSEEDGRLFNTRRLRTLTDPHDIARLMDALCRQPMHLEEWIPKAGLHNKTFDLRVVVIAGRSCHAVVRLSDSPMTNLHLLNDRSTTDAVRARMSPAAWDAALAACERACATFPRSLYAGVDLLVTPDFRRHYVLEINAFGDLLPTVFHQGMDTYTHEIHAVLAR